MRHKTTKLLYKLRQFLALIVISYLLLANKCLYASIQEQLAELEVSSKGRIGIYVINTANNTHIGYRADEHFPMGCTAKVIGVAAILNQSMNQHDLLSQKISYSTNDLTNWSPITKQHLATGLTIKQLCAAAISFSDNTAMNLLVKQMGGLNEMTHFAHTLGNTSFRQDNNWPKEAYSGGKDNLDDSSTPKDMADSLQKLAFTDALAKPQREMLVSWLKANTTGDFRIRAGLPKVWAVADKTGTGGAYGTTNDLGIIWPPKCAPIVMVIYYTSDDKTAKKRDDIVASATQLLISKLAQSDQRIKKNIERAKNEITNSAKSV
ncbi:MAG: class A beta-lactamase [Legionellaceae bacterium]|nr:class A beta-lactamase [Legionellaceae bacterium]HAF87986.1 class A beta-lactamase [Legionellales bacterium]|tara:strand:- start:167 stop:1129 length:963 start_codon:yes stop_codon:yes gene_type:complete